MKFILITFFLVLTVPVVWAAQGEPLWDESEVPQLGPLLPLEYRTNTVHDFFLFDLDGDGAEEVYILRSDRERRFYIAVREPDQEGGSILSTEVAVWDKQPRFYVFRQGPYPFALLCRKEQTVWMQLFHANLARADSLALSTMVEGDEPVADTRGFFWVDMRDINSDLRPDLLVVLGGRGPFATPGIFAFDLFLHKTIWHNASLQQVFSATLADIDGDLQQELVLTVADTTERSNPGSSSAGGCDLIVARSDHGRLVAKQRISGSNSRAIAAVLDTDRDGAKEIVVVTFAADRRSDESFSLAVLDGRSLQRKERFVDGTDHLFYTDARVLNTDHDNRPELYLFTADSLMRRVRFSPAPQAESFIVPGIRPTLCYQDDLDGNAGAELFLHSERPARLWITDHRLQALAWLPLSSRSALTTIRPLDGFHGPLHEYAVLNDGVLSRWQVPKWRLFPPAPVQLNWRQHMLGLPLAVVVFLFLCPLAAIGFLIWLLTSDKAKTKRQVLPDSQRIGMVLLNHRFRVQECNNQFLRVTELLRTQVLKRSLHHAFAADTFKPLRDVISLYRQRDEKYLRHEISLGSEDRRRSVEVEIIALSRWRTIMLLVDISEAAQAERLRVWSSMAQHLVQKTRSPLAILLSTLQRLQRSYRKQVPQLAPEYDMVTQNLVRDVTSVRDSIDSFLKFTKMDAPAFQEDDFTQVIRDALNEYLHRFPETIELRSVFQDIRLPVRLDRTQIKQAFYNVMDNAVAAIGKSGEIMVSTSLETHPLQDWGGQSWALLEISDSGIGIPAEDLVRLYDPGFTTSDTGSGMGLTITRSIVQSHGGGIFIASGPGAGTTVSVRLPLLEPPISETPAP